MVTNVHYMPLKDGSDPVQNPRGMFTFIDSLNPHASILYFGIENIGGLTLKAFSTQDAPQQFTIGVNASLFSKDGSSMPLQALPAVPTIPINPFIVAPQYVNPAVGFSAPSLAVGDVNGDGTPDLIVGNGPGLQPLVTVFDIRSLFNSGDFPMESSILGQFPAYDSRFRGGVWVAAGDLDQDNKAEIITGPGGGVGSQPLVEVFKNMSLPGQKINMQADKALPPFFAYEPNFTGGVRVAVGNVIRTLTPPSPPLPDIVTAPGSGHAPTVNVFAANETLVKSFPAYDPSDPRLQGGVFIAVGDYDNNSWDDILAGPGLGAATGAGLGPPPEIKIFDGMGLSIFPGQMLSFNDTRNPFITLADFNAFLPPVSSPVTTLFPDDSTWLSGVSGVAFGNRAANYLEIVVGSGEGQSTRFRVILTDTNSITPGVVYTLLQTSGPHTFFYKDLQDDFTLLAIPPTAFGVFVGAFGAPFVF
jgi:FG-GAP repeat